MTRPSVLYHSAPQSQIFSLDLMKPLAPLSFCREYWEQQYMLNDTMRMQSTRCRVWRTARGRTQFLWKINREAGKQRRGRVREQEI